MAGKFKRLFRLVIVRPAMLWLSILWMGVIVCGVSAMGPSERFLRLGGMLLQLSGLGLVWAQVYSTRALFQKPGPLKAFRDWCAEIAMVIRPRSHIFSAAGQATGMSTASCELTVLRANPTLETRVEDLEREVAQLGTKVKTELADVRKQAREQSAALAEVKVQTEKNRAEIGARLLDFATGDLFKAELGVVFLVLGTVLACASPELAHILAREPIPPG